MNDNVNKTCMWCGTCHPKVKCPLIAAIDYDEKGVIIRRIEFFAVGNGEALMMTAPVCIAEPQGTA